MTQIILTTTCMVTRAAQETLEDNWQLNEQLTQQYSNQWTSRVFDIDWNEEDRDEYQNKIIELFAQCITDPTNKRIIIDRNRPMDDYYMIDFSSYGQPFEDDTLVTITWYSEDDEKSGDYLEEHNNYIDAANKVAKLLDEGFNEIYVTSY